MIDWKRIDWKRVKSATEWGFFFGIISWLLATGISNEIPGWGVWGIILSRTLLGFIIGILRWNFPWWKRGLIVGAAVNLPLAFVIRDLGVSWRQGFWPYWISGILAGFFLEVALRKRKVVDKDES